MAATVNYYPVPATGGGDDCLTAFQTAAMAEMLAAVPTLDTFRWIHAGDNANTPTTAIGANVTDPAILGGGLATTTTSAKWTYGSVFPTPKTAVWAFSFTGKLPAIVAGNFGYMGLADLTDTNQVLVWTNNTASATKFVLTLVAGGQTDLASTLDADANLHRFTITFDLTTVKLYIDGALVASQTTLTNLIDSAMRIRSNATAGRTVTIQDIGYAYVG